MISRFNYTERQTIRHDMIRVTVDDGPPRRFSATFNFEGVPLPADGRVYVEALSGGSSTVLRFAFGTVAAVQVPEDTDLTDLPGETVHFTVKIVDERDEVGKLLALCENIRPRLADETGASGLLSILPVNPTAELGERVWRLTFTTRPWLDVNNQIPGIMEIARDDRRFFSLVYPEVVRQVLYRTLVRERYLDVQNNDDSWQDQWLRFAIHWHPEHQTPPSVGDLDKMSDEETSSLEVWIDEVVGRFCEQKFVRLEYMAAVDGEGDK